MPHVASLRHASAHWSNVCERRIDPIRSFVLKYRVQHCPVSKPGALAPLRQSGPGVGTGILSHETKLSTSEKPPLIAVEECSMHRSRENRIVNNTQPLVSLHAAAHSVVVAGLITSPRRVAPVLYRVLHCASKKSASTNPFPQAALPISVAGWAVVTNITVGVGVGCIVGTGVGAKVGAGVGIAVGCVVGWAVGKTGTCPGGVQ